MTYYHASNPWLSDGLQYPFLASNKSQHFSKVNPLFSGIKNTFTTGAFLLAPATILPYKSRTSLEVGQERHNPIAVFLTML